MADLYNKTRGAGERIQDLTFAQYDRILIRTTYDNTDVAGSDINVDDVKIVFQPGVTYGQTLTLSGDNVKVIVHPGASVGNTTDGNGVTVTGSNCYIFAYNGAQLGHIVSSTGTKFTLRGGGWGAICNSISCDSDDSLIEYMSFNSEGTPVGPDGQGLTAIEFIDPRITSRFNNVIDSDLHGIFASGSDGFVFGNIVQSYDNSGIDLIGPRTIIKNNIVLAGGTGTNALLTGGICDDSIVAGNYFTDGSTDPVSVNASAENCIITKNRMVSQDAALGGTNTTSLDNLGGAAGADIGLWLEANTTIEESDTTPPEDGDGVTKWTDIAAATEFIEATNTPLWVASGLNSKPEVHFDGTNDILDVASAALTGASGGIWAVITVDAVDAADQVIFAISDKDSDSDYVWVGIEATSDLLKISDDGTNERMSTNTVAGGSSYIVGFISTGTAWKIRLNGADETLTGATGSNNGNWFGDIAAADLSSIGAVNLLTGGEQKHFDGKISEIRAITGSTPTAFEIQQMENYLNDKYAVY